MDQLEAAQALREADRLSARARRSGRWYVRYLTAFAVGSFLLAVGYGLLGPRLGTWILMPIWIVFIVVISVYANRQRATIRGVSRIHLLMMLGWTAAWAATLIGSFALRQPLWWWVLGGLAMATPPLIARHHVQRRLAP